jgi:hypothetical protein
MAHTASASMVCGTDDMVSCAAQLLQISEYRFFHAAYRFWFGRELSEDQMKPVFTRYLLGNTVPFWAAHTARTAVERAVEGVLNPREFGIEPPATLDDDQRALGTFYIALVVLVMGVFMALLVYG